ncbi:MAG: tetratricopeptide repeat protein [Myxococcales bacterium]
MTPDGRPVDPVSTKPHDATEGDDEIGSNDILVTFTEPPSAEHSVSSASPERPSSRPPPLPPKNRPSLPGGALPPPRLPSFPRQSAAAVVISNKSVAPSNNVSPERESSPRAIDPRKLASAEAVTCPPPAAEEPDATMELLLPDEPPAAAQAPASSPEDQARALIARCEALLGEQPTPQRAARLHYELARLWEHPLGDAKKAVSHYQQALERAPDHLPTIRGLRRGLIARRSLRQAADLYDAEARLTPDPQHKARLLYAKGRLLEDGLALRQEAHRVYSTALALAPSDTVVLKALEQCEFLSEAWPDLAQTLARQANALEADTKQRAALLVQRAQLLETRLKDVEGSIAQYETALEIDPDSQDALEALKRLYYGRGRHRDLIRMLELEAARSSDQTLRLAALHGVARLQADKLGNRPDAIQALEAALAFAPRDRLLLEELVQLKEAARDYTGLALVLSELAEALGAVPDRAGLLHRIGQIHDEHLNDPDTAQRWFARSLHVDPCYVPALQALGNYYAARGRWDELMAMHLAEGAATTDVARRAASHARVAEILEKRLDDVDGALEHHTRALSAVAIYAPSFKALTRLFSQTKRYRELIELYERAVERVEGELAITYLIKVGSLYEDQLEDPTQAMHAYRRVLKRDPKHLGSLHALQRAAEAAERYSDLSDALVREAELTADRSQRVALLHRAAEVLDEHLNERDAAMAMLKKVVALDSCYVPALTTLGRIYYQAGRWEDLLALYQAELTVLGDTPRAAQLLFKMAELAENRLGSHQEATELYRRAVTLDPTSSTALRALARKLREHSRWEELIEVLLRDLKNHATREERATIHLRVGEVYEYRLLKPEAAIDSYDKALQEDENQLLALTGRIRLRSARGEHSKLGEDLARAVDLASDPAHRIALLMQLGEVLRDHQRDLRRAIACFEEVRTIEASHHGALLALESLYRKTNQWQELAGVLATSARVLTDPNSRTAALRELARLGGRAEGTFTPLRAYQEILVLSPHDLEALGALELLALEQREASLLSLVDQRIANVSRDRALRASHLTRLGESLEASDPESALPLYRNALDIDPENLAAARGLSRLALHNNEYEVLLEAAEREATVLNDRKTAAALYVRAARATQDDDNAAHALEQALELDPESTAAARELRACLARTGDIDRLTELLARAANSSGDKQRASAIWRQVAALYGDTQNNLAGAIGALERAMRLAPDDAHVMSDLARVLKRDGQFSQAAALLARITEFCARPSARGVDSSLALHAHTELALLYEEQLNKPALAIAQLRAAVKLSANDTNLLHRLSDLLSRESQHAEALTVAHRLVELADRPENRVAALLHLARVEQRRGDHAGLVRAMSEAVALDGPLGGAGAAMREAIGAQAGVSHADYERALRKHVQSFADGRAVSSEIYLELARVQAREIGAPSQAIETLRDAITKQPNSLTLRTQYAALLRETGAAEACVKELRGLLLLDSERASTWRDLADTFGSLGQEDAKARAKEVLRLMGYGPRGVDGPRPGPLPSEPGSWAGNTVDELATDLMPMGIAAEYLAYLGEGLDKLYPPDLSGYGVSSRDRLSARAGHALRILSDRIAALVGVQEYELYVHRTRGRGPGIELDGVPLLLVPAWILEQGESQQVFMLARMLILCARKCHPILKLTPRELDVVFAAYTRNQVPSFGTGLTSEEILDDQGKRLYKALSRRTRKLVEDTAQRYAAMGGMDLVPWVESREREATRAAALLCDDLSAALDCLARSRDTGATDRSEETTGDLYRFWVGEAALRVRRRTS